MAGDDLELLITLVVAADDERQARTACAGLLRRVGGSVLQARDCSDEEPGCWSVTISRTSGESVAQSPAGALARAVRGFVRMLGEDFPTPRVACDPPAAWTVIEDPALLDGLVPGAERLLVEAWLGGDPYRRDDAAAQAPAPENQPEPETRPGPRLQAERPPEPEPEPEIRPEAGPAFEAWPEPESHSPRETEAEPPPEPLLAPSPGTSPEPGSAPSPEQAPEPSPRPALEPAPQPPPGAGTAAAPQSAPARTSDPGSTVRLLLRVDVAADRPAGAEWQARAVASRVGRDGKITRVAPLGHLLSVHVDLGTSVDSTTSALLDAVSWLGRSGWSPVEWSGESATIRWSATPAPITGITAMELTATPTSALVWTEPE